MSKEIVGDNLIDRLEIIAVNYSSFHKQTEARLSLFLHILH